MSREMTGPRAWQMQHCCDSSDIPAEARRPQVRLLSCGHLGVGNEGGQQLRWTGFNSSRSFVSREYLQAVEQVYANGGICQPLIASWGSIVSVLAAAVSPSVQAVGKGL